MAPDTERGAEWCWADGSVEQGVTRVQEVTAHGSCQQRSCWWGLGRAPCQKVSTAAQRLLQSRVWQLSPCSWWVPPSPAPALVGPSQPGDAQFGPSWSPSWVSSRVAPSIIPVAGAPAGPQGLARGCHPGPAWGNHALKTVFKLTLHVNNQG